MLKLLAWALSCAAWHLFWACISRSFSTSFCFIVVIWAAIVRGPMAGGGLIKACSANRAFSRASSSVLGLWVMTWVFNRGWRLPKKWFNWAAGLMLCFSVASMRRE